MAKEKNTDMQGVVFCGGSQLYMEYVEIRHRTHDAADRSYYDAINTLVADEKKYRSRTRDVVQTLHLPRRTGSLSRSQMREFFPIHHTVRMSHTPAPPPLLCPDCDLLMAPTEVPRGATLTCPRCHGKIIKGCGNTVEITLALGLTGLILFPAATLLPLMDLEVLGQVSSASIGTSIIKLLELGHYTMALTVLAVAFLFPLLNLVLVLGASLGLFLGRPTVWTGRCLRYHRHLSEWAMTDVYLIGILVTVIKMGHMAEIRFNTGFFCFIGLVLTTLACQVCLDHHLFWERLDPDRAPDPGRIPARTGLAAGLCRCHDCGKIVPLDQTLRPCPRCGARVHPRKSRSLERTWALVVTALILTLPANLLPIMEVEYFGWPDRSTIMDGIIYFFQEGSYGIGAIILTASILVPLFKITGLILILLSIHFHRTRWLRHKAIMFRFIEFIGRWSMLDIFVISLLCALVRFGFLSTINPAPAALYFTGVVLSTMFAAIAFDPRLLWDITEPSSPLPVTDHGTS